jgi:2,4-dienoyl-CoA reductase-like NADH-dependent reductase (Old Yellow Enzyme family)
MSLWDVTAEPADDALKGRTLMSYFADLPRGQVRLGAAGKVMTGATARGVLEGGCDFVIVGRGAILCHDLPERVRLDPSYESPSLPVSEQHLRDQGLSDPFIGYFRSNWPGFVAEKIA